MARNIWDGFGRRIGSIADLPNGKKHVYDGNGQPLGNVWKTGTFTADGTMVSRSKLPGLLFNKTNKQRK